MANLEWSLVRNKHFERVEKLYLGVLKLAHPGNTRCLPTSLKEGPTEGFDHLLPLSVFFLFVVVNNTAHIKKVPHTHTHLHQQAASFLPLMNYLVITEI